MVGTGLGHKGISSRNCRNHSTSSLSLSKAINSDSIVEWAIHVCLEDFQDSAVPSIVNTYPLVEICNPISILYPSSTGEYYPFLKAYSLVCDT